MNIRGIKGQRFGIRAAALALFAASLSAGASAQWTVVNLNPAGSTFSEAYAVHTNQQVGYATIGGQSHASLWGGSAAAWTDLNPAGAVSSSALSVNNGVQGGWADFGSGAHAGFWSGTALSWTDLDPSGTSYSQVSAIDGAFQAGFADIGGGLFHAVIWNGSSMTMVDVNPGAASDDSYIYAAAGGQQVGAATIGGLYGAGLWQGSAGSYVDLTPVGSDLSEAFGTDGAQQVGYAYFVGIPHAGLWAGTAASWVDLNPVGADYSQARGVDMGQQVGVVSFAGVTHAALWSGTAASFVDLQTFLPAGYTSSEAWGIWHDGPNTYVTGVAFNSTTLRLEAIVWTQGGYSWSGFLPPINQDGSSIFKLGRTIPVKFKLTGVSASITNLQAHLYVAKVLDGVVGTEEEADTNCGEDDGNLFHYDDGQYIFRLSTREMSRGTWRLRADFGDGIERTVLISLKK